MIDPTQEFRQSRLNKIEQYSRDERFAALSSAWLEYSMRQRYVYNFDWLGRPIIQYPQDMVAMQELVWKTRPDLIIETGIAHGGSLVLSASLLALLDYCDAIQNGTRIDPIEGGRRVLGIDIDIREHNKREIASHPLAHKIEMVQGSSTSSAIIEYVKSYASKFDRIMICLDSNHTHEHVLAELRAYAPLVTPGCYCVVFDSFVESMPDDLFPDRPWAPGNNPMTAIRTFLGEEKSFELDASIQHKLQITVAPGGFLKRTLT